MRWPLEVLSLSLMVLALTSWLVAAHAFAQTWDALAVALFALGFFAVHVVGRLRGEDLTRGIRR